MEIKWTDASKVISIYGKGNIGASHSSTNAYSCQGIQFERQMHMNEFT